MCSQLASQLYRCWMLSLELAGDIPLFPVSLFNILYLAMEVFVVAGAHDALLLAIQCLLIGYLLQVLQLASQLTSLLMCCGVRSLQYSIAIASLASQLAIAILLLPLAPHIFQIAKFVTLTFLPSFSRRRICQKPMKI